MAKMYPRWTDSWTAPLSDWPENVSQELRTAIFHTILEQFPGWDELRKLSQSPRYVTDAHRMLMAYYYQLLPSTDPQSIL